MKEKYLVSFCVPVYNRAEVSYMLVNDLLKNKDPRFQVVISDNNSSDNTIELLSSIKDSRLKICRNEQKESIPAVNWYNSLENGDGEFLYFLIGRDKLYSENIGTLIDILIQLKDKNVGCARDRGNDNKYIIYSNMEAPVRMLDRAHPTGLIINKEKYRKIRDRKKYFCIENYYYPENYIKGELLKNSNAAWISSGVFCISHKNYRTYIDKKTDKSKVVNQKKDLFFFPSNNLKYLKRITGIIETLSFNDEDIKKVIFGTYEKHLKFGILTYRDERNDIEQCAHYNIKPRIVSKGELLYELIKFHIGYSVFLKEKNVSWYDNKCKKLLYEAAKECLKKIIRM